MKDILDLAVQDKTSPRSVFKHLIRKNRVYGYYHQQDSHEAFINLLDIMEKEMKKMKSGGGFIFDFQCYLVYKVHCFNCDLTELLFEDNTNLMLDIERNTDNYPKLMEHISNSIQKKKQYLDGKFIQLSVDNINQHRNVKASGFNCKTDKLFENIKILSEDSQDEEFSMQNKKTKLERMVDNFFDYEFFSRKRHDYQCEKCKKKSTYAFKKYYMYRHPNVLVLCVKKFAKSKHSFFGGWTKSSVTISYPEILDLSDHSLRTSLGSQKNHCLYRLVGVVNHSGGLGGGHYTCYVRKNEHWYYISDSYYKESSLKSALKADAYLVFYEKI